MTSASVSTRHEVRILPLFTSFVWSLVLFLAMIASLQAQTPFVDPMFDFTVKKNIVFAHGDVGYPEKTGEMEMTLDLYRPVTTAELPKKLPAMIFVFGGGFKKGSKNIGYIRDLCEYYARRGYVTAAINYRLFKDNPSPVQNPIPASRGVGEYGIVVNAALQDAANSIRWIKENAADLKIDPDRIGIGGVSAGALISLYAGHAEADLLGPNAEVAVVLCFLGVPGMEPSLIDTGDPPTFFGHGEKDKLAIVQPYVNQLKKVGVDNEVWIAPELGHRIVPVLDTVIDAKTVRDRSVDFCFKALKLSELQTKKTD
ncbi:MAG: alpha/beta hydrolase [Pirellulaceae bacterium]|nr:alpha/beta hydrolase [Pirellulaceae bacterium]